MFRLLMGKFIQDVKVTCDLNNGRDTEFKFRVSVSDEEDLKATIAKGLKQKEKNGEINLNEFRSFRIYSNDKQGFFESITGEAKDILNI